MPCKHIDTVAINMPEAHNFSFVGFERTCHINEQK
jgi:hypothetical protein